MEQLFAICRVSEDATALIEPAEPEVNLSFETTTNTFQRSEN